MNDVMKFPKTFDEFIKQYSFFDKQQIYTNGSELIHVFRIKQWEEHKEKENQELKKQLENMTDDYCSASKLKHERAIKIVMINNQQKEFIKFLEDEKDRLIKETSHYYIDSFDRQHAVNETIYDEVDIILQKYKEIIGGD